MIDPELKTDAEKILARAGLTASEAVEVYYRQIVMRGDVPFDLREVAESTVSKYMAKRRGPPSQGWRTFLRNHADVIVAVAKSDWIVPHCSARNDPAMAPSGIPDLLALEIARSARKAEDRT